MTIRRRIFHNKSHAHGETVQSHEAKVHPSPCYSIWDIKRITNFMVVLSVVILAFDHVQLVRSKPSPSPAHSNANDVPTREYVGNSYLVTEDGSSEEVTSRIQRPTSIYDHDCPIVIDFLSKRMNDHHLSFAKPHQPIQHAVVAQDEDVVYYYYEEETVVAEESFVDTLPDDFRHFYGQSPDVENHADIQILHKSEEEELGHVYTEEDYQDDALLGEEEYWSNFLNFDDDVNRSAKIEEDGTRSTRCMRPSWYRLHHPTCNKLHEVPILNKDEYDGYYLASGTFRDAFLIYGGNAVMKISRLVQDYDADLLEMIRMDAMSMDLLRGSPRIVNIYSHCGGSVQVEAIGGPSITELVEHEKRSRMDDPPPMLSPTEKLNMAVEMAEGLADLHGFEGGPIVHNDVQIGQYLIDENYHARMSDFNRADPLLFDNTKGEYCKVILGDASGELRSPEEYKTDPTDEKIDVYSFGNVIQTLLTGHYPYDDYNDDSIEAWRLSVDGITPHVGSNIRGNSFAESALASVMDKCFEYHAEKRIDIFTVVDLLKEAAELNDRFESIEVGSHEEDEWDPETYYDEDGWKKWLPW